MTFKVEIKISYSPHTTILHETMELPNHLFNKTVTEIGELVKDMKEYDVNA